VYATLTDMVQRFGESELLHLTDPTGSGEVDEALLDLALTDACGEVDSYIASVLIDPVSVAPPRLVSVTCDIARYRLYALAGGEPEQIKDRYDSAVRWLKDVAKGAASLGLTPAEGGTAPVISSGIAASTRTMVISGTTETVYQRLSQW